MSEDSEDGGDVGASSPDRTDDPGIAGSTDATSGSVPDDGADSSTDADSMSQTSEVTTDAVVDDDRFCTDCGASISYDAEICPECGVRQQSASATVSGGGDSSESVAAALLSFVIPGAGNFLNGQSERGTMILVLWIAWLVVGWGIGLFVLGGILTFVISIFTFGIGALLWPILALVALIVEFVIHVIAAIDAYNQSEIVDRVTVRAENVRGN